MTLREYAASLNYEISMKLDEALSKRVFRTVRSERNEMDAKIKIYMTDTEGIFLFLPCCVSCFAI